MSRKLAHWDNAPEYMPYCYTCSECKHSISVTWWYGNIFNDSNKNKVSLYCPVCGAKMDDREIIHFPIDGCGNSKVDIRKVKRGEDIKRND